MTGHPKGPDLYDLRDAVDDLQWLTKKVLYNKEEITVGSRYLAKQIICTLSEIQQDLRRKYKEEK
jgi:hypothetical protein